MDCSPSGSPVHGDFPGKNTGMGCCFILQWIVPTQGLNSCLLHWQVDFFFSILILQESQRLVHYNIKNGKQTVQKHCWPVDQWCVGSSLRIESIFKTAVVFNLYYLLSWTGLWPFTMTVWQPPEHFMLFLYPVCVNRK